MALKRSRSRSSEPPAPPAKRQLPWPTGRSPSVPKVGLIGVIAARRSGRLRGQAASRLSSVVPRPGTPPPSQPTLFRSSTSPEPADEPPSPTERVRDDGGRKRKKALYLVMQEHGHGVVSAYAVHRVDLARSQHGISVSSEEFEEPPVLRFKAAPGMAFLKARSTVVGVTDRNAGVVEAESVIIDASTWEVSTGPPPPSTEYGLVKVSGKIYAADMLTEDPRCVALRSAAAAARDARVGWTSLPRPPFRDRILTLAAYPLRRGLLASTERGETFLLDGRRRGGAAWIALPGSARLPWEERAVYAKDHDLWFEVSPNDGRLRAHEFDVVLGSGVAPRLEQKTHRVADPIPVITPRARGGATRSAKLVYLGRSMFCVVQADGIGADGCPVTVTVFRVIDSEMPVTLVERRRRRRRRERGMNARWVAAALERACADKASGSGRRRKLCRVNLWSRTYIARGGTDRCPSLPGVLWM
ncbi:uncharacterized protein [Miscanthus floridulus]|uniref:uncharacterized protein n=1 Tax=Miscanthus floridulus TaxID=154761 RepID=UPI003459527E